MNFSCDTSGIHGVTCEIPQDSSCEWIKDEGKESPIEEFKISSIKKQLNDVTWYKLWMYLRESPTLPILKDTSNEKKFNLPQCVHLF